MFVEGEIFDHEIVEAMIVNDVDNDAPNNMDI